MIEKIVRDMKKEYDKSRHRFHFIVTLLMLKINSLSSQLSDTIQKKCDAYLHRIVEKNDYTNLSAQP